MRSGVCNRARWACLFLAIGAAHARAPLSASPAETFGALFARVQTDALYADSKTFADAIPNAPPPVILRRYRDFDSASRADLQAFVAANFALPASAASSAPLPAGSLREHIAALWPILTRPSTVPPAYSSQVFVPHDYVVPGGRFREFYYWDSYFTMLGLRLDGHADTSRAMVANFAYLIDRFGHIPNGTRTYYLSRSQPPLFYLMVELARGAGLRERGRYLRELEREYAYWMHGRGTLHPGAAREHVVAMPDGSILNRYWDAAARPRDESFREDTALANASPAPKSRLFRDIRAAAESGWDFSARWLSDAKSLRTIHTTDIVPADLNSLLYGLEQAIARTCAELPDAACQREYASRAQRRQAAIERYLWDDVRGRFADYDWRRGRITDTLSAATLYPLFVGLATPAQGTAVANTVRANLLLPGGLVCTTAATGQQWDAPNGWAPLQWIAVQALDRYQEPQLAHEIARRWVSTVSRVYAATGKMLEKYDVATVRPGGGGEYPLQDGFGWTNGVTRALLDKYPDLN